MAYSSSFGDAAVIGKPSAPQTFSDHLTGIRNEVGELTGRLCGIADRVVGSVPSAVSNDKAGSPNHMSVLQDIRGMLSELREQVNRLDNTL